MNKALISIRAVGISLLVFSLNVQAQRVWQTSDLQSNKMKSDYITSPSFAQAMHQLGREEDKKLGIQLDCKSPYEVKPITAMVLKPLEFSPGLMNPIQGVWLIRYNLVRCGESKTYSVILSADSKGEKPKASSYLPGVSLAAPQLVVDASVIAIANAGLKVKECKEHLFFDMAVTEPPHDVIEGDKLLKGVWSELWTFSMCGKLVEVPIKFIPDGKGGTSIVVNSLLVKVVSKIS